MNKILLCGRITRDLELKQAGNTTVLNFNLAVNRRFAKKGDEVTADFINCVVFGKTAEFIEKYFGKGRLILVEGRIQTRTWQDKEGKKVYVTEVVVEQAEFTGEKATTQSDAYEPNQTDIDDSDLPF